MPASTGGSKLQLPEDISSGATIRYVLGGLLGFADAITTSAQQNDWLSKFDSRIISVVTIGSSAFLLIDGKIRQRRKERRADEKAAKLEDAQTEIELEQIKKDSLTKQIDDLKKKLDDAIADKDRIKREMDEAMERRHKWARETGERLTVTEERADQLQAELNLSKSRATVVKDKVNESVDVIGEIVHEAHLSVTPPEPLENGNGEHEQVKPGMSS